MLGPQPDRLVLSATTAVVLDTGSSSLKRYLERSEALPAPHLGRRTPAQRSGVRVALVAVDAFTAVTAAGGALAAGTGHDGERFPIAWLTGTPFRGYRVPGLPLDGVVGGSAAGALAATLRNPRAGAALLGWIGGERRLLKQPASHGTGMEVVYVAVGLLMTRFGLTVGRAGFRVLTLGGPVDVARRGQWGLMPRRRRARAAALCRRDDTDRPPISSLSA